LDGIAAVLQRASGSATIKEEFLLSAVRPVSPTKFSR
jgi:hypothetical protein